MYDFKHVKNLLNRCILPLIRGFDSPLTVTVNFFFSDFKAHPTVNNYGPTLDIAAPITKQSFCRKYEFHGKKETRGEYYDVFTENPVGTY